MEEKEIRWAQKADENIEKHCAFLAIVDEKAADKFFHKLKSEVNILLIFPFVGQIEPLLEGHPNCYRYLLVEDRYKIIYAVKDSIIEIHAVWDCRQHEVILRKAIK